MRSFVIVHKHTDTHTQFELINRQIELIGLSDYISKIKILNSHSIYLWQSTVTLHVINVNAVWWLEKKN